MDDFGEPFICARLLSQSKSLLRLKIKNRIITFQGMRIENPPEAPKAGGWTFQI